MRKITIICTLFIFVAFLNAKAQSKLGYINTQELINIMPESKSAVDSLQLFAQSIQAEYDRMAKELNLKAQEFEQNKADLSNLIKESRLEEINEKKRALLNFERIGNQEVAKKEQELFAPIMEKARKAIQKVAKDEKYRFIFDSSKGSIIYSLEADNVMPLVKKELGIKDQPKKDN